MSDTRSLRTSGAAALATTRVTVDTLADIGRELMRARATAAAHEPAPPAHGLVVDVGGGQAPHPRADVVVDKYVADDFERPGGEQLDLSKPLVIADAAALPFADRAFAYVIASHVLEHATDPAGFAAQFMRIAPAGFVQVPSRESELVFGWQFHPWLIDLEGETLVFEARGDRRAHCGEVLHRSFSDSALFRAWWASTRAQWHHSVEWRETLHVRVEGASTADRTASFGVDRTVRALRDARARGALQPLSDALRDVLRCPVCGTPLTWAEESVTCADGTHAYPVAGGVPVLLEEAAGAGGG
jgi:uncharacterized protein YbaR (Trm112 family)